MHDEDLHEDKSETRRPPATYEQMFAHVANKLRKIHLNLKANYKEKRYIGRQRFRNQKDHCFLNFEIKASLPKLKKFNI